MRSPTLSKASSMMTLTSCENSPERSLFVDHAKMQMMHKFNEFKHVCELALEIGDNPHYFIFKVLSQSKIHKIKHLMHEPFQ